MWNYKQSKRIVEAADAWDVLSSPKFEWGGSFKETLKGANFNDPNKMPTVYSMSQLIKYVTQINYLKMCEGNISKYRSDLEFFGNAIVKFVDNHLKKIGTPDSETFLILDYLGKITQLLKEKDNGSIEIGDGAGSATVMEYGFQSLASIGFKTLNLLSSKGVEINESTLMYMIRDGDVKKFGVNPNDVDRKEILDRAISEKPLLERFQSHQGVINFLNNTDINTDFANRLRPFMVSYARSGLKPDQFMSLIEACIGIFDEYTVKELFNYSDTYSQVETYFYIKKTNPEQQFLLESFIYLIYTYSYDWDIKDFHIEQLRQDPEFKEYCEKQGDEIRDLWLYQGFATVDTMLKYLEENPEKLDNFKAGARNQLPNLAALTSKSNQAKNTILSSGLDVISKAIKEGVIKKIDPIEKTWNNDYDPSVESVPIPANASDFERRELEIQKSSKQMFTQFATSYLDKMEQERQYTTISKEDLIKYAEKLTLLEFDSNTLKSFLNKNKITKLQINDIDFVDGLWRGLFVPRFPTQSGENVPAIIIRTDSYDSLEHHKQLAENLGISHTKFTEATRRHEIAHALHYLASGDLIMAPSEELNPEVTKEEAYLINPSEMYARVHGDIPYLSEIFRNRLSNLMVSKTVYEAAKEQWLQDIVNQKIHLMSGGTNVRRLMMEDASAEFKKENFGKIRKPDGTTIDIPDPQEAVLKILERQRNRLEMIFHEIFTVSGKRDFRRGLIKRKNQIKKELESLGDLNYSKKIELENELKRVQEDLIKSGTMMIFDVSDVSDSVLEGYLKDYFGKVADAVANGLLTSDVLDLDDPTRAKQQKKDDDAEPEKPTAEDIADITKSLIGYTEKIPGGRKFDEMMPVYTGKQIPEGTWTWKEGEDPNDPNSRKRAPGHFPGLEPTKPQPGSNIKMETEQPDDIKDPFTSDKKASVYNHRRLVK